MIIIDVLFWEPLGPLSIIGHTILHLVLEFLLPMTSRNNRKYFYFAMYLSTVLGYIYPWASQLWVSKSEIKVWTDLVSDDWCHFFLYLYMLKNTNISLHIFSKDINPHSQRRAFTIFQDPTSRTLINVLIIKFQHRDTGTPHFQENLGIISEVWISLNLQNSKSIYWRNVLGTIWLAQERNSYVRRAHKIYFTIME